MKNIKEAISSLVESRRFLRVVRKLRYYRNPEERDAFDILFKKKTEKANEQLKTKNIEIEKLKESYEYKTFLHSKKIEFYDNENFQDGRILFKYLDSPHYDIKNMWTRGFFYRKYLKYSDFKRPKFFNLFLIFLFVFFVKLGFYNGYKDSTL